MLVKQKLILGVGDATPTLSHLSESFVQTSEIYSLGLIPLVERDGMKRVSSCRPGHM